MDTRCWLVNSFDIIHKSTVMTYSPNHYLCYSSFGYSTWGVRPSSCAPMHCAQCTPSFVLRQREDQLFSKLQNQIISATSLTKNKRELAHYSLRISLDSTRHSGGCMCAIGHDVLISRRGQWSVCVMRVEAGPSGSNPERNAHEWNVICTYLSFHKNLCVCVCVCIWMCLLHCWLKWNMNKAESRGCVCACMLCEVKHEVYLVTCHQGF